MASLDECSKHPVQMQPYNYRSAKTLFNTVLSELIPFRIRPQTMQQHTNRFLQLHLAH
jgi:hypothetical protein